MVRRQTTNIIHQFQSTDSFLLKLVDTTEPITMLFRSALLIALSCTATQGFTSSASSRQWQKIGYTPTSPLFDTEVSPVWNAQEWTTESLSTRSDSFSPSEDTLKVVKSVFSKQPSKPSKKPKDMSKFVSSKHGIESEYPNKRKIRANVKETGTDSMKHYIKSMCNHELLNKNEEIILAREIQILLKWEDQREQLEQQLLR
jgi:hypothetical protein